MLAHRIYTARGRADAAARAQETAARGRGEVAARAAYLIADLQHDDGRADAAAEGFERSSRAFPGRATGRDHSNGSRCSRTTRAATKKRGHSSPSIGTAIRRVTGCRAPPTGAEGLRRSSATPRRRVRSTAASSGTTRSTTTPSSRRPGSGRTVGRRSPSGSPTPFLRSTGSTRPPSNGWGSCGNWAGRTGRGGNTAGRGSKGRPRTDPSWPSRTR